MQLNVIAYHVGQKIVLRDIKLEVDYALLRKEQTFLLYSISETSLVYIKNYGSIVFFNCDQKVEDEFLSLLSPNYKKIKKSFPIEEYKIIIDKDKSLVVGFDKIIVPNYTNDIAHIVMLNLGQSVALDYYYDQTSILLEESYVISTQLEQTGRVNMSRKKMRSYIGRTMTLKNRIADNLIIFDTSLLAWDTEDLSTIEKRISEELSIVERHHGLQHNLSVVKENLDLFNDILQHKHSSMLEWIIIILILFEIIPIILEKL